MNLEKGEKVLLASYHPLETCMFYFVFSIYAIGNAITYTSNLHPLPCK